MNFIKPNLKSLPEQVDINTNDIKNLKSVIKSSYKTEKELTTNTITIPISDTNAPQGTTSGWLYDSVGHLYSINGGDGTNLLLEYYTSLQGLQGNDGVGIATIENVGYTDGEGYTITHCKVTLTNGTEEFFDVQAKQGSGEMSGQIVQVVGNSTIDIMSQNAVTTELEKRSMGDASNLTSENVSSWVTKLGTAKVDASNLSDENVPSWVTKLGTAKVDASNLSEANVTSWREKLSISGDGLLLKEIINVTCSDLVNITASAWVETPIIYDTISKHAGGNLLSYDNSTGKIKIPANSGYSFVKITSNGAGQMTQTNTSTNWVMGIHATINETITNLSTYTIPYIPSNGGTATSPYTIIAIADVDQDNDTYIYAYFANGYNANNNFVKGTNLTIECY